MFRDQDIQELLAGTGVVLPQRVSLFSDISLKPVWALTMVVLPPTVFLVFIQLLNIYL